jgi:hypothetical protein
MWLAFVLDKPARRIEDYRFKSAIGRNDDSQRGKV